MKVTDIIVESLTTEEFAGFCKGNAIICMAEGQLEKAKGYIDLALEANRPEEPAEQKPKKKAQCKPVDHGKIIALYNGNWKIKAIADEMGVSEQTVRNHIQREAELKLAEDRAEKEAQE